MKVPTKTTDIYFKSLKLMPKNFTSHYFTKTLRGFGVSSYEIANDYYYNFLQQECVKIKRLHWQKQTNVDVAKQVQLSSVPQIEEQTKAKIYQWQTKEGVIPTESTTLTDAEMIEQLKAKGYKVLKQAWKEL
jgi:hypothetical protein